MSLRGSAVFAVTFGTPSTRKLVQALPIAAPTDAFGRLTRAVSCHQQREIHNGSILNRQNRDLLLRHDGSDFGPGRLDYWRFARDRHRFLKRLDTHRDVFRVLEADRERNVLHLDGRETLELCPEVVAAWLQTRKTVPAICFSDRSARDAGLRVGNRDRYTGQHAALRVRDGPSD